MKKALVLFCLLLAVTSSAQFVPVAYWEFQHPEPQGNSLRAVKMIDSMVYVAVGEDGTVVRTSDDGASWKVTSRVTGLQTALTSVDFGSPSTGAALGGTAVVFTNDTGKTWKRVNTGSGTTLYRLYYASPSRVFCVGKSGTILISNDSAKTWKSIVLESSEDLRDIHFSSLANGVICATNGVRYTSKDSGKTWEFYSDNYANNMYAIDFANGKDGAICGELGAVYLTKDSAKTWQKQDVSPKGTCNDIIMLSSEKAIVVADWRAIYMTTNGGSTWANSQPFGSASLKSVSFAPDKKNGVIVGSNGIIMRTYDGATTWDVVFDRVTTDPVGLSGIWATDSMTAVACGSAGLIVRTNDGGKKWTLVNTPYTDFYYDIHFQSSLVGTIIGENGAIIRTRDGGATWTKQSSNNMESLRGVSFLDTSRGIVVGAKGTILMTSNGGSTWINITGIADTLNFRDVAYLTPERAVILGYREVPPPQLSQPMILETNNGGFSWSESTINPGTIGSFNEGYALVFPTPAVGFATGSAGEGTARTGPVLISVDSGNTWDPIGTTLHANYGMSFANRHSGTTVGLDGRTSHTSDGGVTWVEVLSGTSLKLNAVHHPTLNTAFAVGLKTAIIRLTTNDTVVTLSAPRTPVSKKHDILRSVYPNPASELVTFEIGIERTMAVTISLFDVKGNKVASIYDGILPNGVHEANLDVSKLTSGIYFARLDSPDGSEMMKVIVK